MVKKLHNPCPKLMMPRYEGGGGNVFCFFVLDFWLLFVVWLLFCVNDGCLSFCVKNSWLLFNFVDGINRLLSLDDILFMYLRIPNI